MINGGVSRRSLLAASVSLIAPAHAEPRANASLVEPYTEEVARRAPRRRLPYTALYERAGRRLVFVAARHDVAPRGATFRAVDRAFAMNPNALVVEGLPTSMGRSPPQIAAEARRASADMKRAQSYFRGEPGHALLVALARGIPFWGGEPDEADIDRGLIAQGYAPGDIAGVKMLQWLPQGRIAGVYGDNADPRFRAFLEETARQIAADFGAALVFDRDIYERWHARLFGVSVYADRRYLERLDPAGEGKAAALSRAMTLLRDRHVFAVIMRTLADHNRTLVVYGGAHLATQAHALEASLGRPRIV
jgi:hypothetical protein